MPKMPDVQSFEAPVQVSGARAIGSYDLTPLARANEAMVKGVNALGKGAMDVGDAVAKVDQSDTLLAMANANSGFLVDHAAHLSSLAHDQDYTTLQDRYEDGANDAQERWADTISDPRARARFIAQTDQTIAQGSARVKEQAFGLEGDTKIAYVQSIGKKLAAATGADPTNDALFGESVKNFGRQVDGLQAKGYVTPTAALTMKDSWVKHAGVNYGKNLADLDAQGAYNASLRAPQSEDQITDRIQHIEGVGKDARSSAIGGWTDGSWLNIIKQQRPDLANGRSDADILALRADENLRWDMTDANRKQNSTFLKSQGLEATPGNQYLAHFLGPAGAAAVLRADPNKPVLDVLAGVVGPDTARNMVDSNPKVLAGQLAGSVVKWSNGKMGGSIPGGAHAFDWFDDDMRREVQNYALAKLNQRDSSSKVDLQSRIEDTLSEAAHTGTATNPVSQSEFIAAHGIDQGSRYYKDYVARLNLSSDITQLSLMTPAQQDEKLASYTPAPGEGYAAASERQAQLGKAIVAVRTERDRDPGQFALNRIPAVRDAWSGVARMLADPTADPAATQAAARDFANVTKIEQQRAGVAPDNVRILPKDYSDRLAKRFAAANDSDDAQVRSGLVASILREKQLWGSAWPDVMAQMPTETIPAVRLIADGADPTAMSRLLSLPKGDSPAKLLKEQNETKARDLTRELNIQMAPLMRSMMPFERDHLFADYYNHAEKLGALLARDGKDGTAAAQAAYGALVGNHLDLRDTYRIPKSSSYTPDEIQLGAEVARSKLDELGVEPMIDDLPGRSEGARAADWKLLGHRDNGVWVTSPKSDGLNYVFTGSGRNTFVQSRDGGRLLVPWSKLAELARTGVHPWDEPGAEAYAAVGRTPPAPDYTANYKPSAAEVEISNAIAAGGGQGP